MLERSGTFVDAFKMVCTNCTLLLDIYIILDVSANDNYPAIYFHRLSLVKQELWIGINDNYIESNILHVSNVFYQIF